jgi:hypothetical protein
MRRWRRQPHAMQTNLQSGVGGCVRGSRPRADSHGGLQAVMRSRAGKGQRARPPGLPQQSAHALSCLPRSPGPRGFSLSLSSTQLRSRTCAGTQLIPQRWGRGVNGGVGEQGGGSSVGGELGGELGGAPNPAGSRAAPKHTHSVFSVTQLKAGQAQCWCSCSWLPSRPAPRPIPL